MKKRLLVVLLVLSMIIAFVPTQSSDASFCDAEVTDDQCKS